MIVVNILAILLAQHLCLCLDTNTKLYQEVFTYHNETAKKAEFALEVVNKIYESFHQWFYTITFCEFTYFENRILKYTEAYNYGYSVLLLNSCADTNRTKVKPKLNTHGQTAYIVTSNEIEIEGSQNVIEAFKRTGVFQPRSTVIFVINEIVVRDSYFYHNIKKHFQLLWSRSIANSVLIIKMEQLKIFSYNPFLDKVHDISEVKNISHFLAFKNLHGYKIRLSVFRKIYVSDETGPVLCDSILAKTVIQQLNATCEPLVPRDGNTVGDLLDNSTATGVTRDLLDGYTDLELSSRLLKNSYYGYIDTTYPLTQDYLCFLVENTGKQATFTTTINLMSTTLLILFATVFTTLLILAILVRKIETKIWNRNKQSVGITTLVLIKCFLRQTVDIKFWGPVFRIIIAMIILYSLIVNCIVDGIIYSALSNPRFRPELNTMKELINTNLTLGVHNRDLNIFYKSLNTCCNDMLQNRIEVFNDQKIRDVVKKRLFQYATLLRRSDATFITRNPANLHNGRGIFHVVQDCPVPSFVVYGLKYGSPYLTRINFILSNLNHAGILGHWSDTETYVLQRKLSSPQQDRRPLDVNSLSEVFFVLFIGHFISCMAFACEIIVSRRNK